MGILKTVHKVHRAVARRISLAASIAWDGSVKQQAAMGGGLLFEYTATIDKQCLSVHWSRTKGDNRAPNDAVADQVRKWTECWCPVDRDSQRVRLVENRKGR